MTYTPDIQRMFVRNNADGTNALQPEDGGALDPLNSALGGFDFLGGRMYTAINKREAMTRRDMMHLSQDILTGRAYLYDLLDKRTAGTMFGLLTGPFVGEEVDWMNENVATFYIHTGLHNANERTVNGLLSYMDCNYILKSEVAAFTEILEKVEASNRALESVIEE